jgi:hypothetical protein
MREGEDARVEDLRGPAAVTVRSVVRPCLDEAHGAVRIFAQPRRKRAARGAATEDDNIEAGTLAHASRSYAAGSL